MELSSFPASSTMPQTNAPMSRTFGMRKKKLGDLQGRQASSKGSQGLAFGLAFSIRFHGTLRPT